MKVIFFGDFHFDEMPKSGGLPVQYSVSVATDPIQQLIKPLKERYKKEKISLIVFLGDYVNGKASKEEKVGVFERIKQFAERIENECPDIFDSHDNIKGKIVFLDGNHDVSREGNHHEDFNKAFGDYITPFSTGSVIQKDGAALFDFEDLSLRVACVSTTQNAGASIQKQPFKKIKGIISRLESSSPDEYKLISEILDEEEMIDIGSITADTLEIIREEELDEKNTKLVVSHHPLIPMQHATATHYDTVNGTRFLDCARGKNYKYFISGHLHEFYCVDLISRGKDPLPDATLISVPNVIPSPGSGAQYVELDIRDNLYICRLLAYDEKRNRIEEGEVAANSLRNMLHRCEEHTLLDNEIQALIEEGTIIKHGSTERVQAISYDCALGFSYKRYDSKNNTWPESFDEMEVRPGAPATIELYPGERVLLYTHEEFNIPSDMMLHASPRASWIRKGISVELSYFVEPCFTGTLCFPVTNTNNYPIEISAQEAIISVTFKRLSDNVNQGWSERYPASVARRKNKQDM